MKVSNVALYALRLTFGQGPQMSTQSAAATNAFAAASPDRVVTRSATILALFGIALSSFSLKQMMSANNGNKLTRKF